MGRGRICGGDGGECCEDLDGLLEIVDEAGFDRFDGVRLADVVGEFGGDRSSWRFVWLWLRPLVGGEC